MMFFYALLTGVNIFFAGSSTLPHLQWGLAALCALLSLDCIAQKARTGGENGNDPAATQQNK